MFGGIGSDTINILKSTGANIGVDNGNDVIVGDNGFALFDAVGGASLLLRIETTDPGFGSADFIWAGNGSDVVLGGSGGDVIDAGTDNDSSRDIILGDNGKVFFTASGLLNLIYTTDPNYGGIDTITTGGGSDIIFGGQANDDIDGGADADLLVGDNGVLTFDAFGKVIRMATTDVSYGGDDTIHGGSGDDVIIGGTGGNMLYGDAG